MSQQQELCLRAQVLDVVPPGPIHRNRRTAVGKFSHRIPNFREPGAAFMLVPDPRAATLAAAADTSGRKKEEAVSRLRPSALLHQRRAATDVKVPLLLEQREASANGLGPPSAVFKGVPEGGAGANVEGPPLHYVLFRSGNRVTAFPAEQWFGFKPHVDRRGLVDSVNAGTAPRVIVGGGGGAKDKGGHPQDPFALRLVPKSQRMEKQRQDEEARERQEQVAAGRLLPLAGAVDDELGGSGRLRRFVDEDDLEAELFGNDEEDDAPRGFGGKAGKGGARKGRGRGLKNADGEDLEEDEVPEDLYAGPRADEDLRPEKPEEAEDWEHEFAPDDDDQDQGADDEVYDDDPGMRKKLGIEGDDEDEGDEADEQARKLQKLGDPGDSDEEEEAARKKKAEEEEAARRQQAAAAEAAAASSAGAGEEDEQDDEDEDELDELDEMDEEPKPPPSRPPSVPPAARPPPAPIMAAAAAAAGNGGSNKRRIGEEPRPAADGAKRARTATPPPAQTATPAAAAGQAAKAPTAAAAAGAAAGGAPAQPRPAAAAGAAAGAGGGAAAAAGVAAAGPPVTAEEVIELLRSQPSGIMPFTDFTKYFSRRTTTPELRGGLKSLTVSLCKSSKENGVLMVALKNK